MSGQRWINFAHKMSYSPLHNGKDEDDVSISVPPHGMRLTILSALMGNWHLILVHTVLLVINWLVGSLLITKFLPCTCGFDPYGPSMRLHHSY